MKDQEMYDDDYLDDLAAQDTEKPFSSHENESSSLHQPTLKNNQDEGNLTKNPQIGGMNMNTIDNRRILNPQTPRETAEIFINEYCRSLGIRSLQCVPDSKQFFTWVNGNYEQINEVTIQEDVSRFLHNSWRRVTDVQTGEDKIVPYNTRSSKEKEILDMLKHLCQDGVFTDPAKGPSWLFSYSQDLPDPNLVISFKNKLLCVDKFLKSGNSHTCLMDSTPQYFSKSQIPFDIDPHDHKRLLPVKFIAFLEDIFQGEQSSIELLRQWMGYCLTNMTWAQKILLMVGPKRSGKGTIAKVIQSMLGEDNYTNPSSSSLSERFPLEDWANARLAILGDARFGEKKELVKELLLRISGEDRVNIERKNNTSLKGVKLPTKIMILSNEVPQIRDSGDALASRFLILKMEKSFYGNEDTTLFERDLKPEIPRIFWWALDGLAHLQEKRKFIQPESGHESIELMEMYQSPVSSFVRQKCNIKPDLSIPKDTLYNAYSAWCEANELVRIQPNVFSRNVFSAFHSVKPLRKREGEDRIQLFLGISLKDRS